MNLNQLYYFRELARCEHYTKAAEELHITQPSLSKSMAALEQELGGYLFEKQGRNVILTRQGRHYLEYVEAALCELERGNEYMQKEKMMTQGYIDLGMVSSVECDELSDWIQGFRKNCGKNVFFSCKTGISRELVEGLKRSHYDLIFCTAVQGEPLVEFVPVAEQKIVAVVPQCHPFAPRKSLDIKEFQQENMVVHTRQSSMRDVAKNIFEETGMSVKVAGEAEEDRAILGMVKAGVGCAVMTDSSGIHTAGVKIIPLTGFRFRRYVSMGYRKEQGRSYMAEQFRRYVLEQAKDHCIAR